MLSPAQFARVKALFAELCDRSADEREAALRLATDDPAVIAEARRLLDQTHSDLDQVAAPILEGLSALALAPRTGDQLGVWSLHEEIGEGGMGKVFLARRSDGHFQQVAALKLLAGVPNAAALRHLTRERQILANLSHPNIARLFDGGSTPQGQPYLVMEYVQGQPIHYYCRQHSLPIAARLRLLIDVCAAVAHAHQQLVVHCDLKPANILVTADDRAMLLDFGISRLLDVADWHLAQDPQALSPGSSQSGVAYTPRYASPEQKARLPVGTASDIYSLGLVLAELLDLEWSDPATLSLRTLPADLAAIIERANKPAVADRYASVEEFAADLRRYLSHQVVLARPPAPLYVLRKWLRRNWRLAVAAGLLLAVLLGSSLQMRAQRDHALAAERTARAVKDFMVAVFQGANPELSGQRDVPVSKLLDAGSERIQVALADQPVSAAELSGILGSVYQSIGQRKQALAMYDRAIELARRHEQPLLLAEALHNKAYTLYDMGEFGAAQPLAREALALRRQQAGGSIEEVGSMRLLGSILGYAGDRDEAPHLLQQAHHMAIAISANDSVETGLVELDLARYFGGARGQADLVLQHASRAGEIFDRQLGVGHFRGADALEMRVLGLAQAGRSASAVPLAQQLVEQRTALYGEVSHPRSYALSVLGSVLRRAGRQREAVPVFQSSLDIHEVLDGPESVASLTPVFSLARVLEEAGSHAQALELFDRHLDIKQRHAAVTEITPWRLRLHRARNLRQLGRLEDAQVELTRLLAPDSGEVSVEPADRIVGQLEWAALLRQRAEFSEAEAVLAGIDRDLLVELPGSKAMLTAEQGRIAAARGSIEQAKSLYAEAQTEISADSAETDRAAWLLRMDEAELLAQSGQSEAARARAQEIAAALKPSIDPEGALGERLRRLGAVPR